MEWVSTAKSSLEVHSMLMELLLLLLAAVSALLLRRRAVISAAKRPPGPRAWPVIGHLHLLGQLPHQSLCKLAQIYGPLMGLRLGGVHVIVVSTPEMAKEILQTNEQAFLDRPRSTAVIHMYLGGKGVSFEAYGSRWKRMRQLCATELFSAKRLASFRYVREEEVRELARAMVEKGQQGQREVEPRASLLTASNNITCRMMMGKKVGDVQQLYGRHADLNRLIDELLRLLGIFYVGDFIPWLSWLDPRHELQSMKATGVQAKALMQQIIEERRHIQPPRASPQDFLDVLLAACADPNNATPLTEENIMGLILDFFAAGSDSSSIAVEWALANLINNPIAMHKLHEELDLVVGKERLVVESDIKNLPYLRSVMQESMRIHPVGPFILRESIQECQIGLYKVPAKSRVFVNLWATGRDSTTWERPLDFWPERFDNNKLDLRSKTFEMLPFGAGRRGCPGWALGFANIHLMLATLIQGFTWSLDSLYSPNSKSNTQFLDMSERFGLTMAMKKPLCAFATPRLPLHLY